MMNNWLLNPPMSRWSPEETTEPPPVDDCDWDDLVDVCDWDSIGNTFGRGNFAPVVNRGVYEMEYNRFDMEQDLMSCWQVTDDLEILAEGVLEHDITTDQVANIAIGLKDLYNLKFNKVWDHFERSIKATHAMTQFDRVVCQGLDETSEEYAQVRELVRELIVIERSTSYNSSRIHELINELDNIVNASL